jgi:hypothetical protein
MLEGWKTHWAKSSSAQPDQMVLWVKIWTNFDWNQNKATQIVAG